MAEGAGDGHGGVKTSKPMTDEQAQLALDYLPLAKATMFRLGRPLSERTRAELMERAAEVACDAAAVFDEAKGHPGAWMCRKVPWMCIDVRNELMDHIELTWDSTRESTKAVKLFVSMEPPVGVELEALDETRRLMVGLTEREREIVTRRYWNDETQTEVAAVLKLSQSHVSNIEADALGRMRDKAAMLDELGERAGTREAG
jgi:RNA polymerase sigma factor (sigma-70 family)